MLNRHERDSINWAVELLRQVLDVCNGVQETAGDRPGMWEHGHISALVGIALEGITDLVPPPSGATKPHPPTKTTRGQANGF